MAIGSRYWANSVVYTTGGKKMYLSNTMEDLEEQIHSKKKDNRGYHFKSLF